MGELRYMISEAAKQVDVESHVLRYWEEELDLSIDRTEMGHRYYTKEDIELFQCVKKLKEKGMQLKDLKPVIPDLLEKKAKIHQKEQTEENGKKEITVQKEDTEVFTDEKLAQVRTFISDVVTEVILDNNEKLKKEITESVTESVTGEVVHEMDVVLRERERREEEHFHKMDCLIRQQQAYRKDAVKVAPIQRLKKLVMGT
ncbi:MAG: helix-turn-helix domain-containing protein [Hespellia sp.]|nr:helix-turn-helix domain-containing protein [Hespellia sp.]